MKSIGGLANVFKAGKGLGFCIPIHHGGERTHMRCRHLVMKRLQNLHPLLDHQGVLRVEGRLPNADIYDNHKHAILLPRNHHFTFLI